MSQRGFTVIELLTVIVTVIIVGIVGYTQFTSLQAAQRDDTRRHTVNALYYNLEDIFYAKNKYYPQAITETTLTGIDKKILIDPNGIKLGNGESDYRYEPNSCNDGKCKGYTLRAELEQEAEYIKKNKDRSQ